MSLKKRRSRRKTYKDLPGYGTLRTVKGAKDFDQMVECLASFPFDVSAMEQMSDEDQVWTCCYTNQFEKNTGHIAALWNSNADRVNSEDEDPLQVDSAIHKRATEWFKKQNTTPKKRQKGRKRGDSSRKSNASNYWAQGQKTRWKKNDILQYFIDMGYSKASIHQREGKLVVKIDKEHCTGSVIWTHLNRVGADGSDEGSTWEFTRRDLLKT